MLLVQAAELKSSSLETTNFITVETASSSRTTNDTNVESDNAKPAVRPQQPRQDPIYIELDDDGDVVACEPLASSHQPPQQVAHPTSCTSLRPSSLSTVKDSSRRIEPLVHDWSETSLNKLHDLINQIVPPTTRTTTTTRAGCMSSNDVSTKARNGKIAVPMRGVTVCSPKWKAMFDSLLKYKEEFGSCGTLFLSYFEMMSAISSTFSSKPFWICSRVRQNRGASTMGTKQVTCLLGGSTTNAVSSTSSTPRQSPTIGRPWFHMGLFFGQVPTRTSR